MGRLSAKTRTWKWNHTGLTLLYTSTHYDDEIVDVHKLPYNYQSGVIVGCGQLKPVRKNTYQEMRQIEREFGNGYPPDTIEAAPFRYEFTDLVKFDTPIEFKPPKGAVSVFNVPAELVEEQLKKHNVPY
jgi:hypothetical protein